MLPSIEFTDEGEASLHELNVFVQLRIKKLLKEVANKGPRLRDALKGELAGYFKCESGDYRAIYMRVDSRIIVHVVAHRQTVYDRFLATLRRMAQE